VRQRYHLKTLGVNGNKELKPYNVRQRDHLKNIGVNGNKELKP